MKAIVISAPGGPEVLQLQEVEDPELQREDDVLIRVEAAGLNRADTFRRKGSHPPPPEGASPYLGIECSGTILAVGKSVARWKIGDQVALGSFGFVVRYSVLVCFLQVKDFFLVYLAVEDRNPTWILGLYSYFRNLHCIVMRGYGSINLGQPT
jgi:hypothetical protein